MIARKSLFAIAKTLEGVPVLGALEGTPAARAGVRYGDVLLAVNGVRTRTVSDYVMAKEARTDGMHIVVFRSGQEQVLELAYDENPRPVDTPAILAELVALRIAPGPEDGEGGADGGAS